MPIEPITPVDPTIAQPQNTEDVGTQRLKGIYDLMSSDPKVRVPKTFEEFSSSMNAERLSGVYDYLSQSGKVKEGSLGANSDEFIHKFGFTTIPGNTSGVIPTTTLPNTELHKLDPVSKSVQQVNGFWEYAGKVASMIEEPFVDAADYLGKLPEEARRLTPYLTSLALGKISDITGNGAYRELGDLFEKEMNRITSDPKDLKDRLLRVMMGLSPVAMNEITKTEKDLLGMNPNNPNYRVLPGDIDPKTGQYTPSFTSKVVGQIAPLVGDIMVLSVAPETAMGPTAARYGFKTMPYWPTYMALKGSTQGSTSAERLENTATGFVQGLTFEGMGMLSQNAGKGLAKILGAETKVASEFAGTGIKNAPYELVNPLSVTAQGSGMLSSSGTFAVYDAITQGVDKVINGKDFDPEQLGISAITGGVFHLKPMIQGQGKGLIDMWRAKELDNTQKMWTSTSDRVIKSIGEANIDPVVLREKVTGIQDKLDKLPKEGTGDVRTKLLAEMNIYQNVLRVNYQTNEILRDPRSYLEAVNRDPSLTPEARTYLISKINTTVEALDPNYRAARDLENTINSLTLEQNSLEGNTTMPPNMLEARKQAIAEQLVSAKKGMKELFSRPSYFINGERYNSATEFEAAVNKSNDVQSIANTIVRNDEVTAKWVRDKIQQRVNEGVNEGVRAQKLKQQENDIDPYIAGRAKGLVTPKVIVSDRTNTIIDFMNMEQPILPSRAIEAAQELYGEWSRMDHLKRTTQLQENRDRIQRVQNLLEENINELERYGKESGGGDSYSQLITSKRAENVSATENAKPSNEVTSGEPVGGGSAGGGGGVPKSEVKELPVAEVNPRVREAVEEISSFLGDELYKGNTPDVDGVIQRLAEEFTPSVKTPEELITKIKDTLGESFKGNDVLVSKTGRMVFSREDMIRDTYDGLQESGGSAIIKGERVTTRARIREAQDAERLYRETLRDLYKKEQQGKPITSGMSKDQVDLVAKLAISYVREGVKTMDAVFSRVKQEFKNITGLTLSREDFDKATALKVSDAESTVQELMGIREEAISRKKLETLEESNRRKEIRAAQREKAKVLVDELKELGRGYRNENKGARNVLQHIKGLRDWVKSNKDRIDEVGPELSKVIVDRMLSVKDEPSLVKVEEYLNNILQKEAFLIRAKEINDNQKIVRAKLGKGGFGTQYDRVADLISLRYKPGTPKIEKAIDPVTGDIARVVSMDESVIPNRLANEYADVLQLLTGKGELGVVEIARIKNLNDALRVEVDKQVEAQLERRGLVEELSPEDKNLKLQDIQSKRRANIDETYSSLKGIDEIRTEELMQGEKDLLNKIRSLTKKDLEGLTNTQMNRLRLIIDNAKNTGWLSPKLYTEVMLPVERNRKLAIMERSMDIGKVKSLGEWKDTKQYAEIDRLVSEYKGGSIDHTKLFNKLKQLPTNLVDTYFSNLPGGEKTPIYEAFHRSFNTSISKMHTFLKEVDDELFKIAKGVDKERGGSRRGRVTSTILMDMYSLQRMYEADPLHNTNLEKYVDKVIHSSVDRPTKDLTKELFDGLPKTSEGKVDVGKVWDEVLTPAERRMITYMDNVSVTVNDKLRFNTIYTHNLPYKTVPNYTRLNNVGNLSVDGAMELLGMKEGKISTLSGSTKLRTQSDVIYMDKVRNFKQSLKENAIDIYLSPVMKETFGTFDAMMKQHGDVNPNARETVQAIRDLYYENVRMELAGQMMDKSVSTRILEAVLGASYNSVLANPGKAVAEITSNLTSAIGMDMMEFAKGGKGSLMDGAIARWRDGREVWDKFIISSGSIHADRMYGSMTAEGNELYYNRMSESLGASRGERFADMLTHNEVKEIVKRLNLSMIKTPDALVTRPYIIGQFIHNFKRLTKENFDVNQYMDNPEYRKNYEQQVQDALAVADFKTTTMFNSPQKFDQALATKSAPGQADLFKRMNMFIVNFGRREYYSMMMGLQSAAYGDRVLSRAEGVSLVSTLITRNLMYYMAMNAMRNTTSLGVSTAMGIPPKRDEEGDILGLKDPTTLLLGATANILTGRMNNFAKVPTAWALNAGMELYKKDVLKEVYVPRNDAIMYTGGRGYKDPRTYFSMAGPLSLSLNTFYSGHETFDQLSREYARGEFSFGNPFLGESPIKVSEGYSDNPKGAIMAADVFAQVLNLAGLIPDFRDLKMVLGTAKYNSDQIGSLYMDRKEVTPIRSTGPSRGVPSGRTPSRGTSQPIRRR